MLLYSLLDAPSFRTVKLRSKQDNCAACGSGKGDITSIRDTDYVAFCGGARPDWVKSGLQEGKLGYRITAQVMEGEL